MSNKNEKDLKKCRFCGKTITDEKNKSGLCPEHQGKAQTIGVFGAVALSVGTAATLVKVFRKR